MESKIINEIEIRRAKREISEEQLAYVKANLPDADYWAMKSPLIILVSTSLELDCRLNDKRDYALFDVGLAAENLILQAAREGPIAHPIAGFKPLTIKEYFGIPPEYILITLIVLGYPGDDSFLNEKHRALEHSGRIRKSFEEVVMYNSWIKKEKG